MRLLRAQNWLTLLLATCEQGNRRTRGAQPLGLTPGSPNGYIFIFGLQHFAFFFLQQALLWFFPQHDFAFPAAAGVLARATEEAAISTDAQTMLIATALTFLISRIS